MAADSNDHFVLCVPSKQTGAKERATRTLCQLCDAFCVKLYSIFKCRRGKKRKGLIELHRYREKENAIISLW